MLNSMTERGLFMAGTKPTAVFDIVPDKSEEALLDEAAAADFGAGRVMPNADVVRRLRSWANLTNCPAPLRRPGQRRGVDPRHLDGTRAGERARHSGPYGAVQTERR
jgi:hypothetical protein